jgi:hypothetical protein
MNQTTKGGPLMSLLDGEMKKNDRRTSEILE